MGKQKLRREPHHISEWCWWYEDQKGIEIIVEPQPKIEHIRIPWLWLRSALKRKDAG